MNVAQGIFQAAAAANAAKLVCADIWIEMDPMLTGPVPHLLSPVKCRKLVEEAEQLLFCAKTLEKEARKNLRMESVPANGSEADHATG